MNGVREMFNTPLDHGRQCLLVSREQIALAIISNVPLIPPPGPGKSIRILHFDPAMSHQVWINMVSVTVYPLIYDIVDV